MASYWNVKSDSTQVRLFAHFEEFYRAGRCLLAAFRSQSFHGAVQSHRPVNASDHELWALICN
jgi:hypothetical protein